MTDHLILLEQKLQRNCLNVLTLNNVLFYKVTCLNGYQNILLPQKRVIFGINSYFEKITYHPNVSEWIVWLLRFLCKEKRKSFNWRKIQRRQQSIHQMHWTQFYSTATEICKSVWTATELSVHTDLLHCNFLPSNAMCFLLLYCMHCIASCSGLKFNIEM